MADFSGMSIISGWAHWAALTLCGVMALPCSLPPPPLHPSHDWVSHGSGPQWLPLCSAVDDFLPKIGPAMLHRTWTSWADRGGWLEAWPISLDQFPLRGK